MSYSIRLHPSEIAEYKAELKRELEERLRARKDFAYFCQKVPENNPARHHRLLISKLEDVAFKRLNRLMIFMPPGHAKSTYSSVNFPPFYLGVNPKDCIIGASHTRDLAVRFSRKARNIIDTQEYRNVFNFGMSKDSTGVDSWETEKGGEFKASGVGAGIAGRRSDIGLIDDPIRSREDAESPVIRDKAFEWYLGDFRTRLKPNGAIILIQTRWHEEDLAGRILPTDYNGESGFIECLGGEMWYVINLPALAEHDDDLLGRKLGEPLWPEYISLEMLMNEKGVQTERNWASLYQQRPRPEEGNQFDLEKMLVDGQPVPYPTFCDRVFAVIDTAIKDGSKNDGTAVSFYAYSKHLGHKLVLLDWDIVQIEGASLSEWLPSITERLEKMADQTGASMGSAGAFIEDKGSGTILLQQAKRLRYPAQAIKSPLTQVGKSERAINITDYVHQGLFKISDHAYHKRTNYKGKTRNHWLYQVLNFKLGVDNRDDDLPDTFFYGVSLALGNRHGF